MSFDISHLLEHWEYQPGQVMVRKFKGKDGLEKIQLRVDLGLLQMNAQGRPDGKRPMGYPSYYDFCQNRLAQHEAEHDQSDEEFTLKSEDCSKLQLELLQYHHRYICLLQLEDFEAASRDSARNLQVIDFANEYAETDDLAWTLEQFRPQVLMLHTRSRASLHLQEENFSNAIEEIEAGLDQLREFYKDWGRSDLEEQSPEILSLETWLEDVKNQRPLTPREKLELDLKKAIQVEDFEKAAKVRDALKKLESAE